MSVMLGTRWPWSHSVFASSTPGSTAEVTNPFSLPSLTLPHPQVRDCKHGPIGSWGLSTTGPMSYLCCILRNALSLFIPAFSVV